MGQTSLRSKFNVVGECKASQLDLWQCPPFLFLVMGIVTIVAMIATYLLASRYVAEPEIAAVLVSGVTVLLLIIGHAIIAGFNKIAEANHMKAEFVSIITHQLRSPLSVFKWTLNVVERELKNENNPAQIKKFVAALTDTAESMIQLVNTLLEISRMEAQRFVLKKGPFDLKKLTQTNMATYTRYASATQLTLAYEGEESFPLVDGDQERIAIVVQNLIDNAIKYSKEKETITVRIKKAPPSSLRWEIEDRGVGIPKEERRYIFTKFYRASNARVQHTHGTGIGLYTVKAIIEASGGKVGFTSELNQGSTFWFTLPTKNENSVTRE
jgi:signal transduction histidine kinase